ncbi:MAG TPA: hypothetical protein VI112_17180, partial [Bacteroidia bacterium]
MKKFLAFLFACALTATVFSQTSQYASSVISFSSQWSTTSWAATQTLNAPNTYPSYGDISTSWASASADGQREFLELGFTNPQFVNQVNIWETWNPGAVDTIFLRNSSSGQWVNVWSGTASAAPAASRIFTVNFTMTAFQADAIRIGINSPAVGSWNEIDAVQIQQLCGVTVSSTNVLCNGQCNGTATANATGQSPFQYSWSTGATTQSVSGLCAGTYTVVVADASLCVSTASVTITQPTAIQISFTPVNCSNSCICDGSIISNVTGGTPGYTYAWAPGGATTPNVSGLCAGGYTLTVTDANGCTATGVVTIGAPAPMQVNLNVTNNNSACACNGSITANVTGGNSPYTYSWAPTGGSNASATGLCQGGYTVYVTDAAGCTASVVGTVTQPQQLQATASSFSTLCNGSCDGSATVIPSGGTSPYFYSWFPTNCSTQTCTGLCAGSYTVEVT